MSITRTAAASAVLALFMLSAAPLPQVLGPSPAAAQGADQLLADQTPLNSMDDKALNTRIKGLKALIQSGNLSKAQKQDARAKMKEAQAEIKARRAAGKQAPANQQTQSQQTQQAQPMPSSSPDLQAIITDKRPLDQLSDAELHARIKAGIDARKAGNLSRADKQAVNQFVPQARAELKKRQTTKQDTKPSRRTKTTPSRRKRQRPGDAAEDGKRRCRGNRDRQTRFQIAVDARAAQAGERDPYAARRQAVAARHEEAVARRSGRRPPGTAQPHSRGEHQQGQRGQHHDVQQFRQQRRQQPDHDHQQQHHRDPDRAAPDAVRQARRARSQPPHPPAPAGSSRKSLAGPGTADRRADRHQRSAGLAGAPGFRSQAAR